MAQLIPFPTALRTQDIARRIACKQGYGRYSIEAYQRQAVRYQQQTGCTPNAAAVKSVPVLTTTFGGAA